MCWSRNYGQQYRRNRIVKGLKLSVRRKMVQFDDVIDALKETIRATGKTEEEKARYEKHMVQEEKLISRMEA